jgi:nucleotide-binding universal stress UspA family protein
MIVIKKILVPTDFSSLSVPAIAYASSLAKDHDAEVLVTHAVPTAARKERLSTGYVTEGLVTPGEVPVAGRPPEADGVFEAKRRLLLSFLEQRLGPEILKPVKIRPVIRVGKVVDEIVATAKEEQCDLIVMTSHASRLRRLLRGSFIERIVRQAPCPVLTIQPSAAVRTDKDERVAVSLIDRWAA